MKIGTYEIDLRSAAIGALVAWIGCTMFVGSGDGNSSSDAKSSTGHWYDFGNGMVNLDRVNLITTSVRFRYADQFKITDVGCEDAVKVFTEIASDPKSTEYDRNAIKTISAQVEFDDFTLTLEDFEVKDKSDIRRAFRSWKQTLSEIKKAQR